MNRPLTTAERAARGVHPAATPDYAALATQAVEALSGKRRKDWGDQTAEYEKAVNQILRMWAIDRGVAVDDITPRENQPRAVRTVHELGSCPGCHKGRMGPNGGVCIECARNAKNAARRKTYRAAKAEAA